MITGFNTEFRFNERTIHVQTEEMGLQRPEIQTLIYVGGIVLDRIHSDCSDLLKNGTPECEIMARMEEQHKQVVLDIKNGKYDDRIQNGEFSIESAFQGRPLLDAVLDYLGREGKAEALELLLKEPLNPRFGSELKVSVAARLCVSKFPIPGADVTVNLVADDHRAVELASGKTGADGFFDCSVLVPPSQPWRCSIVVSCVSEYGEDALCAIILD